jgi:hypothetical protein
MHRLLCAALVLAASVVTDSDAVAAGQCQTFSRAPPCCPHPPPQCCPAPVSTPIDDALVQSVCGPGEAKGETYELDECKRYYARGDQLAQVAFGRQPGDAAALAKIRKGLAGPGAQLADVVVAGVKGAFVMRALDEKGATDQVAVWALAGAEIVHLDVEVAACNEAQAVTLFSRAIERMKR